MGGAGRSGDGVNISVDCTEGRYVAGVSRISVGGAGRSGAG